MSPVWTPSRAVTKGSGCKFLTLRPRSMHVHRVPEVGDDALGAQPAGFLLVLITAFAVEYLLVANGHAPAAYPVVAIA